MSQLANSSARSNRGKVTAVFALDSWVMLDLGGKSIQRRARTKRELASALSAFHLSDEEAKRIASELWATRPRDAGETDDNTYYKTSWRGALVIAAIIALMIAGWIVALTGHV